MADQLSTRSKVYHMGVRCHICHTMIEANTWCLVVTLPNGNRISIHDNDKCLAVLKVNLGLAQPNILTSFGYSMDNM